MVVLYRCAYVLSWEQSSTINECSDGIKDVWLTFSLREKGKRMALALSTTTSFRAHLCNLLNLFWWHQPRQVIWHTPVNSTIHTHSSCKDYFIAIRGEKMYKTQRKLTKKCLAMMKQWATRALRNCEMKQ